MNIKTTSLIFLFLILSLKIFSKVNHWETIVKEGDACTYLIPKFDIGTSWNTIGFDDGEWLNGTAAIGYNDDGDNTIVPDGTMSVYMRFQFTVLQKESIEKLLLDIDYDDGYIAYINGVEVARANVNDPVKKSMELDDNHEANNYKGIHPDRFEINQDINSLLVVGENILAVEVHNKSTSSSDMSSIPFLHVGVNKAETTYSKTPDWFQAPVAFDGYNLPLMIINTNGATVDRIKVTAEMGLINNGEGKFNNEGDDWNDYSGKISIKRRGESSYGFEKRQYSIELQNEDGSNNNVSLLGLPAENDFVLYGPYSDKTMMKNVLTYELYNRTGRWAPRTRYIEVIFNGDYRGIYVLTEKLKRDKNRVDIDKLTAEDTSPEAISGGYILRRDKTGDSEPDEWWKSPVSQPYHNKMWYEYYDPKRKDLTTDQANYIKNWMKDFDTMMSSKNFADPENGYNTYIKVNSFIDMMFINEITKGIDNYNFSNYFYKENDADGGLLVAGPPWDYNLAYGNVNYGLDWFAPETYGWCYTQGGRIYWFERLMEDKTYRNKVSCRWTKFRDGIFSDESVLNIIDSCENVMGEAIDRNFYKYPTLGKYIWPAKEPIPETYNEEVENLRFWLIEHLHWMDEEWYGTGECEEETGLESLASNFSKEQIKVYPNPSNLSHLMIEFRSISELSEVSIEIVNMQGVSIDKRSIGLMGYGTNRYQLADYSKLTNGIYFLRVISQGRLLAVEKIVKCK